MLNRENQIQSDYSLQKSYEKLNLIQLQRFENEDQMEQIKFGKSAPKINLCFENGKVGYWNKPK